MGETKLIDRIKDIIGCISWRLFLWSINMTEQGYNLQKYNESILLGKPKD
jgi:hypothetical protein